MRALIAFDKFKDALSAEAACAHVAFAMPSEVEADAFALTDGGEGFCSILTRAAGGELQTCRVTGPRGEPVEAQIGWVAWTNIPATARAMLALPADTRTVAMIEMAQASGLALLPSEKRDPWWTTTYGTGELIRRATEAGASAVLLGVGGSATNDLGLGALAALGWTFKEKSGRAVRLPVPAEWERIEAIEGGAAQAVPPIRIACDVNNPLLGPRGATAVYGPQKGLAACDVPRLEAQCERMSGLLCGHFGRAIAQREAPGTGAAGGITFGLQCAAEAKMLPGFDFVAAWFDLERRLAAADVVLTGEGRFDESSLEGKGPGAIVRRALGKGKPVHVFAGQIAVSQPPAGLHLHAITPEGIPLERALKEAGANLTAAVGRVFASS